VPGSTALAGLAGTWTGTYVYANPRQQPVAFVLTLEVMGGVCRGRSEEPNTFGHRSAPQALRQYHLQPDDRLGPAADRHAQGL
jgi:hypothetical protein